MLQRRFGKTAWDISAVGLGTWNLGNQWKELTDNEASDIIRVSYENGVNLFDTAESYGIPNGMSEIRLGKAMKDFRDSIYVVSKIGNWGKRTGEGVPKTTVDMIRVCGHAICGRLRTDRIDVVLCHEANIMEPEIYVEGFEFLKKEGFVREYGISTNDFDVLQKFYDVSDGKCAVLETDYSLINKSAEDQILPFCQEKDIAVLVRGPVAMGLLADKYNAETVFTDPVRQGWNKGGSGREGYEERLTKVDTVREALAGADMAETAVKYVFSHPMNPVAIPGATTTEQAERNAAAGASTLSDDLYKKLR